MMVGSTWKAKMEPERSVRRAQLAEQNRGARGGGASILVTTPPAQVMARWPKSKRSTRKAKKTCRPSPHATVRQRICLRSVEPSHAASSTARIPSTPVNRSNAIAP